VSHFIECLLSRNRLHQGLHAYSCLPGSKGNITVRFPHRETLFQDGINVLHSWQNPESESLLLHPIHHDVGCLPILGVHLTSAEDRPAYPGSETAALMLFEPPTGWHQDSLRKCRHEFLRSRTASERYFIRMASASFSVPRRCLHASPHLYPHSCLLTICQRHRFSNLLDLQDCSSTYAAIACAASQDLLVLAASASSFPLTSAGRRMVTVSL